MANKRHSYVAFYPSDWRAGTSYLSRMHKAAFFDICCYTWDTAQPCPPYVLASMLNDIKGWRDIVQDLIDVGKLTRNDDGSVVNAKAEAEAEKAFRAWKAMSDAGKGAGRGRGKGVDSPPNSLPINGVASHPNREPEPEPLLSDTNVSSPTLQPGHVVEAWNEMASRIGLPTIRKLTPERRRKLLVRIRDHPLDEWMDALNAIERCTWMHGENDRGWRADFDFLLQPSSFQKLIEGSYDRQSKH